MSSSESDDDGGGIAGTREVAYRLFAAEYDEADLSYSESDEERAPNYVVTPTGARVNRLFVVGVLTEVESVSDDVLRARVVDPTGAFVLYAGQYQPDEQAFLERADPPAFVAVTGKARTFQPDDSDQVFTSVRPESISEVTADTRDRWTVQAARQTIDRVEAMATGLALGATGDHLQSALVDRGVEPGLAEGIDLAIDHYGTTPTYLAAVRGLAVDAATLVAGEIDEVPGISVLPNASGDVTASDLLEEPVEPLPEASPEPTMADEGGRATGEETASGEPKDGDVVEAAGDPGTASEPAAAETEPGDEAGADVDGSEPDAETPEAEADAPEPDAATSETDVDAPEPEADAPEAEPAEPEAEEPADSTVPDDSAEEQLDEPAEAGTAEPADSEGPGDFEPGDFDLDDEEREEIESEYGTEFQSGSEVEEPGEAGIDTPDEEPETPSEPDEPDPEDEPGADVDDDLDAEAGDGQAGQVDLADAVMDAMAELDDGDGADRSAVVEAVVDRTGADAAAAGDAIQDALMDGRCYEPDEDTLKPI